MGLGNVSRSKGGGKPSSTPSKSDGLIEGSVPLYKGDVEVSLTEEEPIIVTIFGQAGLGKTHMGFTFPHVACCDTEMKGEKVWRKYYAKDYPAYHLNSKGEVEAYEWDDVDQKNSRLFHAEDWGDIASFYK